MAIVLKKRLTREQLERKVKRLEKQLKRYHEWEKTLRSTQEAQTALRANGSLNI
ncbi:MAG: hypothetical protein UT68_C0001G0150 [Parcubacteria group bacterium GW2011_GWC2_40_10]|nr:MAG: hypothetical protein UT25_C0001G0147 [Parcubacteria group bacterium GW2011_GWC1_39_12]KKR19671.1 MAG: hypothetical protein UT49_C0001G0147 [Parcubacteria group bacterium GW2011_GWF1_39_37]KKR35827.1 MAG: hypothetical protein UT68_C0001G0150 [Parcubacteria group bacterium GW2011_GWC2_40_10]KKR52639.1 MAG: hypothetical protein UT89_C0001G0147 [Parcubacteria group bacterium GW2011_GWE1_40_20]KKR65658.1 MAG: hypothetical protein UU06_C0013G0004 [Parcubacteria group bacterium GW2011_GWB1_40_